MVIQHPNPNHHLFLKISLAHKPNISKNGQLFKVAPEEIQGPPELKIHTPFTREQDVTNTGFWVSLWRGPLAFQWEEKVQVSPMPTPTIIPTGKITLNSWHLPKLKERYKL